MKRELGEKEIKSAKKTSAIVFIVMIIIFTLLVIGTIVGIRWVGDLFGNLSIN